MGLRVWVLFTFCVVLFQFVRSDEDHADDFHSADGFYSRMHSTSASNERTPHTSPTYSTYPSQWLRHWRSKNKGKRSCVRGARWKRPWWHPFEKGWMWTGSDGEETDHHDHADEEASDSDSLTMEATEKENAAKMAINAKKAARWIKEKAEKTEQVVSKVAEAEEEEDEEEEVAQTRDEDGGVISSESTRTQGKTESKCASESLTPEEEMRLVEETIAQNPPRERGLRPEWRQDEGKEVAKELRLKIRASQQQVERTGKLHKAAKVKERRLFGKLSALKLAVKGRKTQSSSSSKTERTVLSRDFPGTPPTSRCYGKQQGDICGRSGKHICVVSSNHPNQIRCKSPPGQKASNEDKTSDMKDKSHNSKAAAEQAASKSDSKAGFDTDIEGDAMFNIFYLFLLASLCGLILVHKRCLKLICSPLQESVGQKGDRIGVHSRRGRVVEESVAFSDHNAHPTLEAKVLYNGETKDLRVCLRDNRTYEVLRVRIAKLFDLGADAISHITWTDGDDDTISIKTDADIAEAFSSAEGLLCLHVVSTTPQVVKLESASVVTSTAQRETEKARKRAQTQQEERQQPQSSSLIDSGSGTPKAETDHATTSELARDLESLGFARDCAWRVLTTTGNDFKAAVLILVQEERAAREKAAKSCHE